MPNVHNATFLGTRIKYAKKLHVNYSRCETLSFLFDATPGDIIASPNAAVANSIFVATNNRSSYTKSILDGPDLKGTNIHNCIANGILQLLIAIGNGSDVINIFGYSRGGVEAIIVSHILQLLKEELAKLEFCDRNTKINMITIINRLKLPDSVILADKQELDKIKLALNSSEITKHVAQINLNKICQSIKDLKINILAIDPVPGGGNYKLNLHWQCDMMLKIPPIVENYQQFIYLHERTRGFKPILPLVVNTNKTKFSLRFLPGHHGTGTGNLAYQHRGDGLVRAYDEKLERLREYDTSTVQELLLCYLIIFLEANSSGFKFKTSDFDKTEEQQYSDSSTWALWMKKHKVGSLKQTAVNFIEQSNNINSFFSKLYKKIEANLPGYESMSRYSYVGLNHKGLWSFMTQFSIEESFEKFFRFIEPKRIILSKCLRGFEYFFNYKVNHINALYNSTELALDQNCIKGYKEPILLRDFHSINDKIKYKVTEEIKKVDSIKNSIGFYFAVITTSLVALNLVGYFFLPVTAPIILAKLALVKAAILNFALQHVFVMPILNTLSAMAYIASYVINPLINIMIHFSHLLAMFVTSWSNKSLVIGVKSLALVGFTYVSASVIGKKSTERYYESTIFKPNECNPSVSLHVQ